MTSRKDYTCEACPELARETGKRVTEHSVQIRRAQVQIHLSKNHY